MNKIYRTFTLLWAVPCLVAVRLLMKAVRPFTSEKDKRTVDEDMRQDITLDWDEDQLNLFIHYVDEIPEQANGEQNNN